MRHRAISRPSATLLVAVALGLGVAPAHAGPCSSKIAQFEQAVRQTAGNPNAGPMAPQSIGAQLDRQPTPASVRRAEQQAQAAFAAALRSSIAGEGLPEKIGTAIGLVVIVLLFAMFFYAYSGIFG
jgi:hypothetical protein